MKVSNGENSQIFVYRYREDSSISLKDSYLKLDFYVTHRAAGHARYAHVDQIRIVKLGALLFQ